MHSNNYLCNIYKFCPTNLQILDSIWVVIAQKFCMLKPTIQHLVQKVFVIVNVPNYTRNTTVYCFTDYVCKLEQQLTGYAKIFWWLFNK